jgi:hypothetical protein
MATTPCADCIDGVSPYNPSSWGYFSSIPDGYQVGSSTPVDTCASSGDPNLGIIANECGTPKSPPISVKGVPYIYAFGDCPNELVECIGGSSYFNLPKCDSPGGDKNKYGICRLGTSHPWYVRDWGTELQGQGIASCCFMDPNAPNRTQTCPPNLWYGAAQCQSWVTTACSQSGGWNSDCDNYLNYNLNSSNGSAEAARGVFLSSLAQWSSKVNGNPSPSDPFVQTILKWAPSFAGNIGVYLNSVCSGVSRDQIASDSTGNLAKLCSCYLQPNEYYLPGIIPPECDSLCSVASSTGGIPIYEWALQGPTSVPLPKICEQTTCVIDQVTLDYINSNAGNIDFSQICGSCGTTGGCTCIINGVSITSINSSIPGVNFNQECGSFSSANGGIIPPAEEATENFWDRYKYLILGGIVLLCAIVLFFLIRRIK